MMTMAMMSLLLMMMNWCVVGVWASEWVLIVALDQCWHSAVMVHFPDWISLFRIGFYSSMTKNKKIFAGYERVVFPALYIICIWLLLGLCLDARTALLNDPFDPMCGIGEMMLCFVLFEARV